MTLWEWILVISKAMNMLMCMETATHHTDTNGTVVYFGTSEQVGIHTFSISEDNCQFSCVSTNLKRNMSLPQTSLEEDNLKEVLSMDFTIAMIALLGDCSISKKAVSKLANLNITHGNLKLVLDTVRGGKQPQ